MNNIASALLVETQITEARNQLGAVIDDVNNLERSIKQCRNDESKRSYHDNNSKNICDHINYVLMQSEKNIIPELNRLNSWSSSSPPSKSDYPALTRESNRVLLRDSLTIASKISVLSGLGAILYGLLTSESDITSYGVSALITASPGFWYSEYINPENNSSNKYSGRNILYRVDKLSFDLKQKEYNFNVLFDNDRIDRLANMLDSYIPNIQDLHRELCDKYCKNSLSNNVDSLCDSIIGLTSFRHNLYPLYSILSDRNKVSGIDGVLMSLAESRLDFDYQKSENINKRISNS